MITVLQVLGAPSLEQIKNMNPNYKEYKFPKVAITPWSKTLGKKIPPDAFDLVRT